MSFLATLDRRLPSWLCLLLTLVVAGAVYLPGVQGPYVFDDYPNIVDNDGVHPGDWSPPSLITAALSSPSSEFKRPLASLSFAVNYLLGGANPAGMKATNIGIHLLNGVALFFLMRLLFAGAVRPPTRTDSRNAVIVTLAWLILPINLTAVLYIVQRMESMANLCVLLGLLGYVAGRRSMIANRRGFTAAVASILFATAIGVLAKETAILTPLYAGLVEWIVFRGQGAANSVDAARTRRVIIGLYIVILALPLVAGLLFIGPSLLAQSTWAPRNFTMTERLLSECRIVADYIEWTLLPTPTSLSFYHDDFTISRGWLAPWTTFASALFLAGLLTLALWQRRRRPLVSLGICVFFACHLLTATIIPLELIYEHRNYPASMGLALAFVAYLRGTSQDTARPPVAAPVAILVITIALAYWTGLTAYTAWRWRDPASLNIELANRAPESPRAQYELGRTMVILSHYDASSPYAALVDPPLKRAAALPGASILPEQALIFFEARMHRPIDDTLWTSMTQKLRTHPVGIEDESALISLTTCKLQGLCDLPNDRMVTAYLAALSHPNPRARLLAAYADLAWHSLGDRELAFKMLQNAVSAEPSEPAYRLTLARRALSLGRPDEARRQLAGLQRLDIGGRLAEDIRSLHHAIDATPARPSTSATP
ncbi:bacterial transcriptional activator domain-containing protein [Luteibacter aegosomaticola]|uniref:tetratricopeptide repeat protein n=1 Tax=Luteibacter aegosomaticola TaxID=2911538 RepID=UPI001FF79CE5|nr:bacterial transcriptional activator domain-containing protein [Luteibacter aegosomaticola]UPG91444.1 bacterial transcriptional activator domain-containing protein [Luteibacter aegosomaticola]